MVAVPRWLLVSVVCALVAAAPALHGADTYDAAAVLAAARSANLVYKRHVAEIAAQIQDPDPRIRQRAILTLGQLIDPLTLKLLLPLLESAQDPNDQVAAATACGRIGSTVAVPSLRALADGSKDGLVRLAALNALVQIKSAQPQDYLNRAKDPDPVLSGDGLTNAGTLAFDKASDALAQGLTSSRDQITRRMCAIGLGRIGDKGQAPALIDALGDSDPGVRRYAAEALVKLNYTPAIPYLLMALEGDIAAVYINRCLMLLSGQDFGYDWRDNEIARVNAVEKGFQWWSDNAEALSK